VTILEAASMC